MGVGIQGHLWFHRNLGTFPPISVKAVIGFFFFFYWDSIEFVNFFLVR